ncbi:MAG: GNAT family N-acetyltransferase [Xanthomonadales bacterium]|nr:GNAT family N-acetyltransferase [Xanthomonadales bacterium]
MPNHIRPASRDDAAALAFLINEAGEGLPMHFWAQSDPVKAGEMDAWEYGASRAARDEGDFSWRNAWVVEKDGEVAAMLLGFVIEAADIDLEEIPEIVRPLVKLEQEAAGSWYINAIAVRPELRGAGMGSELLGLAHALAIEAGCTEVSLQNFTHNADARRLYHRIGFEERFREPMPRIEGLPDFGESILHVMPVNRELAGRFVD